MVRKGSKISKAKQKRRNQKRNAKRKYLSSSTRTVVSHSQQRRRYLEKEDIGQQLSDGSFNDDSSARRMSDRKYVESNVKSLRNQLTSHSSGNDVVDLFGKKLESLSWHKCSVCHTHKLQFSKKCWCSKPYIMNSKVLLVGHCPKVLSDLTLIEQLLIARVHPVVQVYRLVGGQTGYSGHVINFFQDVKEVAKVLPHTVSDLKGIVNICYDKLKFHKDFKIRKQKVVDALLFLKENNKYYNDVVIDSAAVDALPLHDFFHGNRSDMENTIDDAPHEDEVISTAVPSTGFFHSEDKLKHSMNWPKISTDAVKELTRPYIAQAFPVLFPYGEGDLHEVRDRNLTPRIYFQYLMDYEDGRFSSHKIFPYFALNTVMRWECLSKGTVYIKDHPNLKKMNIEVLKDIIRKNPDYMKDILVYGSNIRGTREFWASRSSELSALCDLLGLPTIFFTASAADMRWPRLKELICQHFGLSSVNEKTYYHLVLDNPKICSDYFYEIFTMFFESIVLGSFEVVDYWYRFEWQMRGSPHVHGVMWLQNAVDVNLLETKFDEVKVSVIKYFDQLISCESPNLNFTDVGFHPCSIKIADVTSVEDDLSALINTVQIHVCSKKCTNDGTEKCRYGFPKDLREESDLVLNRRKYYEFHGKRNHPNINQHNVIWLRCLRSNGDFGAILSDSGFRHYASKYASKSEIKSRPLLEILSSILSSLTESTSVTSTIQRSFIKALVERDYSGQEVHHLLCGNKLFSCSRSFIKLNLKTNQWKYHVSLDDDKVKDNYNHIFYAYSNRPSKLHNVCLLTFVEMFNVERYSVRKRKAVAVVYPRLRCTGDVIDMEEIARQLVLLYVPWHDIDKLSRDGPSWVEMMKIHKLSINRLPYYRQTNDKKSSNLSDHESDEEETEVSVKDTIQDDWMLFVGASVGESNACFDHEPLGNIQFSKKFCTSEDRLVWMKFIDDARKNGIAHVLRYRDEGITLSDDQKQVINLASCQISCIKDASGLDNFPQLVLCQGAAGCGKTLIIAEMECMITEAFGPDSVLIIAFTGAAALNANGRTIHSSLRLQFDNKSKDVIDLKGETLQLFQEKMKNLKFLIIEEFSMVGCRLLNIINRRCMQMKSCNQPFGGLPVYMFGDLNQLPPIGDTPLYNLNVDPYKTMAYAGSLLFKSMVRTKFLSVSHRQSDQSFLNFLDNLSSGYVSPSGQTYILDRFEENMDIEEIQSFSGAVHLYQYVKETETCNKKKLMELGRTVIRIEAKNNNSYAKCSSDDLACNLQNFLEIAIGARVMLRSNLWTEGGLVNGCIGYVEDIVYCDEIDLDFPAFILVKFESYYGPTLENGCVPITRIMKSWSVNNIHCTRFQFPLTLAYAITIHKCQGLTLSRIILHLDSPEIMSGIFYVAMSRVREKTDMMIAGSPFHSPLFRIKASNYSTKIDGKRWLMQKSL